jgi:perosamine synthetase
MTSRFIPQMEPWFTSSEAEAVSAYMSSGGWVTEFKMTEAFEGMIAAYTGARHCVVTNNGTVSLTLAALAAGIKPGDEVIVPNYTQIATPNSVLIIGAKPVFVDVEPDTLCLDIDLVRNALTKRTRAISLVAANGRYPASGIAVFEEFCADHGLILIEDSAQALGCFYPDGRHIGRAGLIGSFSFSVPKIITTGQGGCLVTDDEQLAAKLRRLKDFGRASGGSDIHSTIGYNFKFTDLQAAVGIEQIKTLEDRIKRKKLIYDRYAEGLAQLPHVRMFKQSMEHGPPWFIDVMVDDRSGLQARLKEKGIGTRFMYPPINAQEAYQVPGHFPVSEQVGRDGLWLPSASQLSLGDVDQVCGAIRGFYA